MLTTDQGKGFELTDRERYIASFQRVGAVYEEAIALLSRLSRDKNWSIVKERVYQENFLKKGSSAWIKDILRAIEHRFFDSKPQMPNVMAISKFVNSDIAKVAKIQALYQYTCISDPLVARLITGLVSPLLFKCGACELTKETFSEFMAKESEKHPELLKWSPSVSGKWQRNFFAFLRASGIMEKKPNLKIVRPVIRIESFSLFLLNLLQSGLAPVEVVEHPLWSFYFLKRPELEHLLVEAQGQGWIYYSRAGDIAVLKPRYPSLEEWLEIGLEH